MAVIFFDFDSTIVKKETLDDAIAHALANHPDRASILAQVEEITRLGMEGLLGFKESVQRRIAVVPLSKSILQARGEAMLHEITTDMPEVITWLRDNGHDIHIVSGGFSEYIAPVAEYLNIPPERQHTNRFIFSDSGYVQGVDESSLLWSDEGKTPALRAIRTEYPDEMFIMVGDGYTDYKAYESGSADTFIGFGEHVVRESVRSKAPRFAYSAAELLSILKKDIL